MKYIRTKDGRIFEHDIFFESDYYYSFGDEEIDAQADTIKKMCDEFVVVYKDKRKKERIVIHAKRFVKWQVDLKKYNVYGSIWVKGKHGEPILKPVAKMNDKGELELL